MLELQQQQSNIGLVGCFAVVSIGFAVFAYTYFYPFKPLKKVIDTVRPVDKVQPDVPLDNVGGVPLDNVGGVPLDNVGGVPLDSVGGVLLLPLLPIVHYTWAWNSYSPVIYTLSEIWFAHSNSYFNTDYLMFILTNNLY